MLTEDRQTDVPHPEGYDSVGVRVFLSYFEKGEERSPPSVYGKSKENLNRTKGSHPNY